jgi:hypothetical protein
MVKNHAGAPIQFFWVNTFDSFSSTPTLQEIMQPLRNGTDVSINTFANHIFAARFLKHIDGIEAIFTKGPGKEAIVVEFDEEKGQLVVHPQKKLNVFDSVDEAAIKCKSLSGQEYVRCLASGAISEITRLTKTQDRVGRYRDALALRLRNYTCADPFMPSSEAIETYPYRWAEQEYTVKVLLDIPSAKIWTIDDFVRPEECELLEHVGRPLLRRATVAAEDGSSVVSEHRKAQQASYHGHQTGEDKAGDPLWDLQQRVLALTNYHANFTLSPEGQEGLTIIQYNPDDQYFPHCDGSCDGEPHVATGRVATAVLYCKVPEAGGATTFTKANIFVKPKPLAATFFSYKGPDNRMDIGFTEHSGCPVLRGEKLITTFWMREGVTADADWTQFDPSGIRIMAGSE